MSEKKTKETIAKEEIEEQELKSVAGGADERTDKPNNAPPSPPPPPPPLPDSRYRF